MQKWPRRFCQYRSHVLLLPLAVVACACVGRAQQENSEFAVKAAIVYNLARFVEWPAGRADQADFVIGVLSRDPIAHHLEEAVAGRKIGSRPIRLKRLRIASEAAACQIVYLSRTSGNLVEETLRQVRGLPVLTIGDSVEFSESGGIIELVTDQQRLQFDINLESAGESGLRLSSHVLKLARSLRGRQQ